MYKYINVLFSIDCAAQCFREFCCRSANFRNIPFKDGRENCELLHGVHALAEEEPGNLERCDNYDYLVVGQEEVNKVLKGVVTRGNFFLQLAYVYNSTGACNIFFTQIFVSSCKKKLPHVTAP